MLAFKAMAWVKLPCKSEKVQSIINQVVFILPFKLESQNKTYIKNEPCCLDLK
jgi:hypothetical protein